MSRDIQEHDGGTTGQLRSFGCACSCALWACGCTKLIRPRLVGRFLGTATVVLVIDLVVGALG